MNGCGPYSPAALWRKTRRFTALPSPQEFPPHMNIRTRKLIGTVGLLCLVVVWSLLGMAIAQAPLIAASKLAQVIYYVVAGIGWILPAMPLIAWMARPDAPKT